MSYATATSRYGLREAPAGLTIVQDFLNTRAIVGHGADLLADRDVASSWARATIQRWAADRGIDPPALSLSPADLRHLRELRGAFELMVGGPEYGGPERDATTDGDGAIDGAAVAAPVAATLIPGAGNVTLAPSGTGWRWLASALWIETYRSQQNGTWPRLKRCRNTQCGSTFYDGSRNNSGVWHDVRTCGNVANLRASRARRRVARADPPTNVAGPRGAVVIHGRGRFAPC
jgi:predicted RNA-binding Zn ribbon-like protein